MSTMFGTSIITYSLLTVNPSRANPSIICEDTKSNPNGLSSCVAVRPPPASWPMIPPTSRTMITT